MKEEIIFPAIDDFMSENEKGKFFCDIFDPQDTCEWGCDIEDFIAANDDYAHEGAE